MPVSLGNKVIITVAQTGAIVNKKMNPNIPEQPDEIAASAWLVITKARRSSIFTLAMKAGENTARLDVFQSIHDKIRAVCPLIIQDSTGGGPSLTQEERINCLKAGPEMASLNMGSLMRVSGKYAGVPWSNMPQEIEIYVTRMNELGVKPEMEIYSHAMFRDMQNLIDKGLVAKPYYVDLVLGMRFQGCCDATPKMLIN